MKGLKNPAEALIIVQLYENDDEDGSDDGDNGHNHDDSGDDYDDRVWGRRENLLLFKPWQPSSWSQESNLHALLLTDDLTGTRLKENLDSALVLD